MPVLSLYFCLKVLLLWLLCAHATAQRTLPRHAPFPGGVAVLKLGEADAPILDVTYGGNRVLTVNLRDGIAGVVGIALSATPGTHKLVIGAGTANAPGTVQRIYEIAFEVKAKNYVTREMQVDARFLAPSEDEQKRLQREAQQIEAAQKNWRDVLPIDFALSLPAVARVVTGFGEARIFNGQAAAPHAGVDLPLVTGTKVHASAQGRVINTGDYLQSGLTVFVDHGRGFITHYSHLSRIDVKVGDTLERGSVLGLSGGSGQATRPHLHWGVLLNGAYVDPVLFLDSVR